MKNSNVLASILALSGLMFVQESAATLMPTCSVTDQMGKRQLEWINEGYDGASASFDSAQYTVTFKLWANMGGIEFSLREKRTGYEMTGISQFVNGSLESLNFEFDGKNGSGPLELHCSGMH